MKLEKGQLRVYYASDTPDMELDGTLTFLLVRCGYELSKAAMEWSNRKDLTNGVRELYFDKDVARPMQIFQEGPLGEWKRVKAERND